MAERKAALVVGAGGQDGPLVAASLSRLGLSVTGTYRYRMPDPLVHFDEVLPFDSSASHADIGAILEQSEPDIIVYFAGQSSVQASWDRLAETTQSNAAGYAELLQAVRGRETQGGQPIRIVHASSSEMFGAQDAPCIESTPFRPNSPYALSKAYSHSLGVMARENFGLQITNAIMFNHESSRRPLPFVFRRISLGVAALSLDLIPHLSVGSLSVVRDWGSAEEYAVAIAQLCVTEASDDFIVATGQSFSLRAVVGAALEEVGLGDRWDRVKQDPYLSRPHSDYPVLADPSKILTQIGWSARSNALDVIRTMVRSDLQRLSDSSDPLSLSASLI